MLNRSSAPWVRCPFSVVLNKAEKKENLEVKYIGPCYAPGFLKTSLTSIALFRNHSVMIHP